MEWGNLKETIMKKKNPLQALECIRLKDQNPQPESEDLERQEENDCQQKAVRQDLEFTKLKKWLVKAQNILCQEGEIKIIDKKSQDQDHINTTSKLSEQKTQLEGQELLKDLIPQELLSRLALDNILLLKNNMVQNEGKFLKISFGTASRREKKVDEVVGPGYYKIPGTVQVVAGYNMPNSRRSTE